MKHPGAKSTEKSSGRTTPFCVAPPCHPPSDFCASCASSRPTFRILSPRITRISGIKNQPPFSPFPPVKSVLCPIRLLLPRCPSSVASVTNSGVRMRADGPTPFQPGPTAQGHGVFSQGGLKARFIPRWGGPSVLRLAAGDFLRRCPRLGLARAVCAPIALRSAHLESA